MQSHLMTWISGTKAVSEQRIVTLWPADQDIWRLAGNNSTGLSSPPSTSQTAFFLKIRLSGDLSPAFICLILRWSQMTSVQSKTEKWESGSVASSNSSHFDFSSNADEVFSQIGLPESVTAAEFITLWWWNISTLDAENISTNFPKLFQFLTHVKPAWIQNFSTLRKFTKKLVLKRKCSHTKSHQHFIFL